MFLIFCKVQFWSHWCATMKYRKLSTVTAEESGTLRRLVLNRYFNIYICDCIYSNIGSPQDYFLRELQCGRAMTTLRQGYSIMDALII